MTSAGRPLRFLVGLLTLWVGVRIAQSWPSEIPLPTLVVAAVDRTDKAKARGAPQPTPTPTPTISTTPRVTILATSPAPTTVSRVSAIPAAARSDTSPAAIAAAPPSETQLRAQPTPGGMPYRPTPPPRAPAEPPRLRGSGWLIARSGTATPFAPQLGGSQAGVRLTYALDSAHRVALAGRFSSALGTRQQEAALGIDWRPTALPIHLVAEQRIGIQGARGGPSLGLIGGIGPLPVAGDLQLDAYAQGGAIARDGVEGFVDGAIRMAYPVATIGPARLELGLGAWGAAQRGAARLDAGPSASIALPIAGRGMRASLEWRQRLAGRAAPTSGPALSLGTDF